MANRTYVYENSFHPANVLVAACNQLDLEQFKTVLQHARNILKRAQSAAEFARGWGILKSAVEKFETAIKKVDRVLKEGKSIAGDVEAGCEIIDAMDVLMRWQPNSREVSSDDAARAFDKLFGGVAHFFAKVPPPFNAYASVLEELAKQNFFLVISRDLDPTARPSGHDQWDEIDDPGGSLRRR